MTIQFEKEVCEYLSLPSIPKKEWTGDTSFDKGVAELVHEATKEISYAVCTFNADKDTTPRILKVFSTTPFNAIGRVFIVPNYMETNIEDTDLDEESKKKARELIAEAEELTHQGNNTTQEMLNKVEEKNPYYFDFIHDDTEAAAFITSWNKDNRIKGIVPSNSETLKLRLATIYAEEQKKLDKNKL